MSGQARRNERNQMDRGHGERNGMDKPPFPAGAISDRFAAYLIPLLQVGIEVGTPAPDTAQYNRQVDFDHNEAAGPVLT